MCPASTDAVSAPWWRAGSQVGFCTRSIGGDHGRVLCSGLHATGVGRLVKSPFRDEIAQAHYAARGFPAQYAKLYEGSGSVARYMHSRLFVIEHALVNTEGGELLDVGCGPGVMVRALLDTRPNDFRVTAVDGSEGMAQACAARAAGHRSVNVAVGQAEALPLVGDHYDVVLAMGVLEYTRIPDALTEIARVTRQGGLVLLTMHNPVCPYRFVERSLYDPAQRILRMVKRSLKSRSLKGYRRSAPATLRTLPERQLRAIAEAVGLRPIEVVYFDVAFIVPPFDRYVSRWRQRWRTDPERTVGHGWRKRFGTAYMLAARKWASPEEGASARSPLCHRRTF